MMKTVRMIVDVSGTRDGAEWPRRGGTVDLPDTEADELIYSGMAEPVEPAVRTAGDPGPAKAEKAAGRK